jgi:glucose/arabinose dehydrogenase
MSNGVHTIELVAVSASAKVKRPAPSPCRGLRQKRRQRCVFPDARFSAGEARDAVGDHVRRSCLYRDVVARELKGPLQLASTPDGRLLIAESDGRVRIVRPGQLDGPHSRSTGRSAQSTAAWLVRVGSHPDFERNQFVYLSFLAEDGPDQMLLRIIRLREVGIRSVSRPRFSSPASPVPPRHR